MEIEKNKIENCLYIVPTPIGNLEDITLRAIKILSQVDIIAAEDTRNAAQLLKSLDIPYKKLISYYDQIEAQRSVQIISYLQEGKSVALISDAGMPLISDPGFKLVKLAHEKDIKVVVLPGAIAFTLALVGSAFPVHRISFVGFPPHKKGRETFIKELKELKHTIILYESSHRLLKLLKEICDHFGEGIEVCVARELTKLYEEYTIDSVDNVYRKFIALQAIKGEFVVLINNNGA
ncbi:MAG TPA: 16S rRNA (cytidine(1402)-2'-O)-methyltransferase [Candidatus Kapabacteria bacterium]|nr:16S rRNA (cytidine(1402)-2'-O)-methyltransferase [Candidatus Kapabacteria bacterium]